jgi:hypothetical protein
MTLRCQLGALLFLGVAGMLLAPAALSAADQHVDYLRDVRPILSRACYNCHGPDEEHRKAGLRLDRRESAVAALETGSRAVVPGQRSESELYLRITSEDPSLRMPPKGSGHELKPAQIELLGRWIDDGAAYAQHWSFVAPRRAMPPKIAKPDAAKNAIDHFIRARLEGIGLEPAPEADRYQLIRRLSLDLRGLPPAPAEVEAFVNDASPRAYEQLVDRFLDDHAFGERWARMWLDLARYADSMGLGSDPLRTIWRYRDWVIDALNRNVPFDQFTIEQIAGDLLPDPTLEQRIATAFHRNTLTNTEGGTDDEEFRVAAVKDRVDTTLQVWMGLTIGCAKCHNHKFDPVSQVEYYQLFAIFNQTADNDQPNESPTIAAPTAELAEQLRQSDGRIAELERQLSTSTEQLAREQSTWEASLGGAPQWTVLRPERLQSAQGAALAADENGVVRVDGSLPDHDDYTLAARLPAGGLTAVQLEVLPDDGLPAKGSGRAPDGNFVLSRISACVEEAEAGSKPPLARYVRIDLPGKEKILSLAEVQVYADEQNVAQKGAARQSSVAFEGPAELAIDGNTDGNYYGARSTTHTQQESDPYWEVDLKEMRPVDRVVVWNRTDGGLGGRLEGFQLSLLDEDRKPVWQHRVAAAPNPQGEYAPTGRVELSFARASASYSQPGFPVANALAQKDLAQSGWAVGPQVQSAHIATFVTSTDVSAFKDPVVVVRLEHKFKTPKYLLGKFRFSVTASPDLLRRLDVPADVLEIVALTPKSRTEKQRQKLAAHYRSIAPSLAPLRDKLALEKKSRPQPPTVPVMVELPPGQSRATHVMIKGNFLTLGGPVKPGVPAAFHALPEGASVNRLALARWLVDRQNPLTARVMVNRLWAQLFGTGLVETEEDFGSQGDLPTHPELLDWLAVEFQQDWNLKALIRMIVNSATYRQTARVATRALELDPRNRLLSRGPRFRLEAEMVRDQALALAGLLSRKMHGPSVYPPQPPGLWQAAFNGERTWNTSAGEDRYRRGLYTLWRRTVPYPSMATFDAPSRETCTVRRIRTNTPLQAVVTMNDPVYVEAAQALARRMVREGGDTPAERAGFGLTLCLARPPHADQIAHLVELYHDEAARYAERGADALALATDPLGPLPEGMRPAELAAWTVVANVLLNLDAVLTK